MATSGVAKAFHLQQTDLVETADEDVDDVTIVRSALGEIVVELVRSGQ